MNESFGGRHNLVNLVLVLVLVLGTYAFWSMPRAQYPEVRLNWVAVATVWPGVSSHDVERSITLPLEAAVRRISGVRYVGATSRDHVSTLLIRFDDLPYHQIERQLQNLGREIQATASGLPKEARPPQILELTTSSLFHTALVLVQDQAGGTGLCRLADTVKRDLEAMEGCFNPTRTDCVLQRSIIASILIGVGDAEIGDSFLKDCALTHIPR